MSHYYMGGAHRKRSDNDLVWHRSETAKYFPLESEITVREGMELAEYYDMTYNTAELVPVGSSEPLPGRYVLTIDDAPWSPDETIFTRRIVGNRYEPMQPWRLAEILEGLNTHWPLEGTMVLKDGEILIVQLKIDEFAVGNMPDEKHYSYLTCASDLIQGGLIWLRTDIRARCWNTYSASLNTLDKIRLAHSANADSILAFLAKVEEKTIEAQKQSVEQLNAMFTRKITKPEFASIVDSAFPEPKKTTKMKIAELAQASEVKGSVADSFFKLVENDQKTVDWREERNKVMRTAVGSAYSKFNKEQPYAADTAYAAFNAVTEVINHSDLFTGAKDKQMVSLMFGDKARKQQKAWDTAVALL